MATSVDANPEDSKPEVEKKAEPRRRKSEAKKERAPVFEGSADASAADAAKSAAATPSAGTLGDGGAPSAAENGESSKALAPAGVSPVDPFLVAKAEDKVESPIPPRSLASRLLDYSAHAAIIVGLIGFALTVSGHVIGQKKDVSVSAAKSTAPANSDAMGELRLANIKLHEELKALKASVDSLRIAAKRDTTPEQVRMLSAGLENVRGALGTTKSETSAAIAQLQGKIDKLTPGKMQALADRVGRLEHQSIDTPSTGSIARSELSSHTDTAHNDAAKPTKAASTRIVPGDAAAKSAPTPPAKPAEFAKLDDKAGGADDGKPPVIPGWVVRDVYQGVALVEGKRGTLEVVPGVAIPGAGVVKSIERKGGGWVITTSKGQLAYAGAAAQREQRDYRRGYGYGGDYGRGYPAYRDGY